MQGRKRSFEPGQFVSHFSGLKGIVLSERSFNKAREILKEGHKPGRYFVPGCCQHPDYVIQVPVLFEDGTWDVMRGMNLKKVPEVSNEKREKLRLILKEHDLED